MHILVLGWAAALLAATVAIPQVVRVLRTGTTAGISVTAWRLTLGANLAWAAHGFLSGHANIWLPNLLFACSSVIILNQLRRDHRLGWLATFGPSALLGALTFVLDLTIGPLGFAVAAALPSVLAQLVQFQELVIAPRIAGVSIPFLALNVVNQTLWLSWAIPAGERSVVGVAGVVGSAMALNLVWAILRRHGVVRARLALMSA